MRRRETDVKGELKERTMYLCREIKSYLKEHLRDTRERKIRSRFFIMDKMGGFNQGTLE